MRESDHRPVSALLELQLPGADGGATPAKADADASGGGGVWARLVGCVVACCRPAVAGPERYQRLQETI